MMDNDLFDDDSRADQEHESHDVYGVAKSKESKSQEKLNREDAQRFNHVAPYKN